MSRACNLAFFVANLMAFIASIPFLAVAWLMMTNNHTHCDDHLYPHVLEIGLVLLIISLLGMIGLCYRIKSLLWIYLFIIVIRIVVHILLITIAYVLIRNQRALHHDYSKGDEYKIEDFAGFATDYADGNQWEASRSCVTKYNLCRSFDYYRSSMSPKDFMLNHPVLWGCCQPPESCRYRYEGEMMWGVPENGIQSNNTDCYKYSNNKEVLCTNCDTCKAGFLAFLYGDWLKLVIANSIIIGFFLFMVIADAIAIRDLRRREEKY
ncbi:hypothetical protein QQ045_017183 [Rhodiola kirilowii]